MRQELAPDGVVARIAARQHGIVTGDQLLRGITPSGISRRVAAGRLYRIHRGVYSVGHRGLAQEGRWMAALMARGDGAVLSHRRAGALWRLIPLSNGPIDVMVPRRGGRKRRPGVRLHRSATLLPSHCTLRNAIPVTKPARTLADLHRVTTPQEFRNARRQAEVLGFDLGGQGMDSDPTRSELEHRFLRLCRRYRVPTPEVNVRLGPFLVDFLWRD